MNIENTPLRLHSYFDRYLQSLDIEASLTHLHELYLLMSLF